MSVPYCHNPELIKPPFTPINSDEIFVFLNKRKSLLDGVAITAAGNRTLQKDLPEFCERVKNFGFPIKLDTNGSRPKKIEFLIKNSLVNYIAMDIKSLPENYSPNIAQNVDPADILESINVIKTSGIPHEFRTTCVKPFVNADIMHEIAQIIDGANLFVLQKVNFKNSILHPTFFENNDSQFSTDEIDSFQKIISPYVTKTMIR